MDIEGYTGHMIVDNDEKLVLKNLTDKILEYKDTDPKKAREMASAVILQRIF